MTVESVPTKEPIRKKDRKVVVRGGSEAVYGLGLIGAAVYYIGHATTFWLGVLGLLKAIVWPALLIFDLLKYLHM